MPAWVQQAVAEYIGRMPQVCQVELQEIPAKKRGKNADTVRILRDEAQAVRESISSNSLTIVLDRKGRTISTLDLAKSMQQWIDHSQDVAIVIGGPEGVDSDFLQSADRVWSLSAMTFAHPLARIMVAEQLYRAWSINANLPYHRGD